MPNAKAKSAPTEPSLESALPCPTGWTAISTAVSFTTESQAGFPNTEKGYTGAVRREKFVPGKTYVFWQAHWWGQNQSAVPDLALAFTIVSERGRREFGEITWR